MWRAGAVLAAAVVAVGLARVMQPAPVVQAAAQVAAAAPAPSTPHAAEEPASAPDVVVAAPPPEPTASTAAIDTPPAHWSMADARERGDDRTPPLQRAPDAPVASAWQLSDHADYARREADLHARARADYVRATDAYLPELASGIARGREAGVPAEAIAKMEAKLKRLQALREELSQPAN